MSFVGLQSNLVTPRAFKRIILLDGTTPQVITSATGIPVVGYYRLSGYRFFTLNIEFSAIGSAMNLQVNELMDNIGTATYTTIAINPALGMNQIDFGGGIGTLANRVLDKARIYASTITGSYTVRYAELLCMS